MEQKRPGSPVLRVSIISGSRNQGEHLKSLIEQHGSHVVGMSGFHDYGMTGDESHSDVLLVDLDQTDDTSLTRLEKLMEQSSVPVLFNESTSVPMAPGAYRDNWVDNLVGKLSNLATHRNLFGKSNLLERPRYAQTTGYALPNVLIVAHSKTRRRVLQIILAAQGIKNTTETPFEADFIAEHLEHFDALLVDEHNVSPEEQLMLNELMTQARIPVQLCNSSTIPCSVLARRQWGIQLAGKIIKISKFKTISAPPANAEQSSSNAPPNNFIAINGEREWGNRLSAVLARVRTNLMEQATNAKVRRSAQPDQASTAKQPADTNLAENDTTPVPDKTGIESSQPNNQPTSEIERFFDFDKELDHIEEYSALGEGHLLNSAPPDEILTWNLEEESENPFNHCPTNKNTYERAYEDANAYGEKPRSRWRESLQGIRKKLPKLFH